MLSPPLNDLPASPTSLHDKIIFAYKESLDEVSMTDNDMGIVHSDDEDVSSVSYRALPTGSDTSSVSFIEDIDETKVILPAMEIVIRNLGLIQQRTKEPVIKQDIVIKSDDTINYSMETPVDMETNASSICQIVNIKHVPINHLGPREQEEAG